MKFGFGQPLTRKEDDTLLRGRRALHRRCRAGSQPARGRGALAACAMRRFRIGDLGRVRAMPGVRLVLTAADIGHLGSLPTPGVLPDVEIKIPPHPVLAREVCALCRGFGRLHRRRHPGCCERCMGSDRDRLASAAACHRRDRRVKERRAAGLARPFRQSRLRGRRRDAAATKEAFAKAAKVVELTIVNQRLVTNYLDTRGVVAEYDGSRYTLTLGSQGSHIIRDIIAGDVMKLPPDKMRVITP
jgi:carbon-monoxide dehydrogenase large subunit